MKIDIKDLRKALDHVEKKLHSTTVNLEIDNSSGAKANRLQLRVTDINGETNIITIFDSDNAKMPEITKTERL